MYKIGETINAFRGHEECVKFDITDDGAMLLVFFQNPTKKEIEEFASGKYFEIRFLELDQVIMVTTKIGDLNWMDAPYTPHLSPNLTTFQIPDESQGLGLMLVLIDAVTGEIKTLRLLGLSEEFTRKLFGVAIEHRMDEFDPKKYNESLQRISTYRTSQIAELSKVRCVIN